MSSDETLDLFQQITLAQQTLNALYQQAYTADSKISALVGSNTLLAAALAISNHQFVGIQDSVTFVEILSSILLVVLLGAIAYSTLASIMGLTPRTLVSDGEDTLFFFGNVAKRPYKQFFHEMTHLSSEQMLWHLLVQVHANSIIVQKKFYYARHAGDALRVGVISWLLLQLAVVIAH